MLREEEAFLSLMMGEESYRERSKRSELNQNNLEDQSQNSQSRQHSTIIGKANELKKEDEPMIKSDGLLRGDVSVLIEDSATKDGKNSKF